MITTWAMTTVGEKTLIAELNTLSEQGYIIFTIMKIGESETGLTNFFTIVYKKETV